jgi:hypothetical protein
MMTGTCICLANKFNFINERNREGGLFKPEQTDLGTIKNIQQAREKKRRGIKLSYSTNFLLLSSITISRIVKANAFVFFAS